MAFTPLRCLRDSLSAGLGAGYFHVADDAPPLRRIDV